MFLLCFCLTQNEYSSHYRFTSFVTKSAVILGRLAPRKESGFCDFEEFNYLHCWWLRNEMVEICILLDGMVMNPVLIQQKQWSSPPQTMASASENYQNAEFCITRIPWRPDSSCFSLVTWKPILDGKAWLTGMETIYRTLQELLTRDQTWVLQPLIFVALEIRSTRFKCSEGSLGLRCCCWLEFFAFCSGVTEAICFW